MVMTATHANSAYKSIITLDEVDVNVANNTNNLYYKIQLQSSNNYNFANIGSTIKLKINGSEVFSNYAQRTIGKNTTITMAEGKLKNSDGTDYKIKHNSDGSKSINVEYTYSQSSTESYTPKAASVSGTMTLTTIPRKTTAKVFNGTVEKSTKIEFSPASSSFTHSLKLTFGSNAKWLNSSGGLSTTEQKLSGNSFTFNVPSEYYTQFTGTSSTGTLLLTTYSGTTSVGTSTATFTINADSTLCLPYLTGELKDTNSVTSNLTSGSSSSTKIVKGYSTATATLSNVRASSSNDSKSTITSLIINGSTQTTSTRSYSKTGYTSSTMSVYVKNSRGFSKTFTLTATGGLVNYSMPTLDATFKRTTETGSEVTATYKGTFFNSSFGSVANALNLSWGYKESGATSYTAGGTLTPTISGNNFSGSINCGNIFDYTKSYDFIIYYGDKLETSKQFKQPSLVSKPLFGISKNGNLLWYGAVDWDGIPIKPEVVSEW